jgi:hypothetical protein
VDAEAGEGRIELQEWLSAVGGLAAMLVGAILILGFVYVLVAAH